MWVPLYGSLHLDRRRQQQSIFDLTPITRRMMPTEDGAIAIGSLDLSQSRRSNCPQQTLPPPEDNCVCCRPLSSEGGKHSSMESIADSPPSPRLPPLPPPPRRSSAGFFIRDLLSTENDPQHSSVHKQVQVGKCTASAQLNSSCSSSSSSSSSDDDGSTSPTTVPSIATDHHHLYQHTYHRGDNHHHHHLSNTSLSTYFGHCLTRMNQAGLLASTSETSAAAAATSAEDLCLASFNGGGGLNGHSNGKSLD